MTDLRTAAQQALEALHVVLKDDYRLPYEKIVAATDALKAALAEPVLNPAPGYCKHCKQYTIEEPLPAEPVQEPVAWRWGYRSVTTGEMDWRGYVEIATDPKLRSPAIMEPLYTAPPQRKPLTDEEIEQEYKKGYADGYAAGYDNGDSEGFTRGTDSMVPASLAAWRAETKPLTEAQIYAAIKGIDSLKAVEVARAIEKAHGIT